MQSLYSKGVQSDDTRLSNRHIFNKLLTLRSKLVSQKIKKNQKISQWTYQTLSCVELEKVSQSECPCVTVKGCFTMRSKYRLPKPLTDLNKHIIQYVTGIDPSSQNTIIFNETTTQGKNYKEGNRYASKNPDYYIYNGYLYITSTLEIEMINITGIFHDPQEVRDYVTACDDVVSCTSILDEDFPIDEDLLEDMFTMSPKELIEYFNNGYEDKLNNSNGS